MTNTEDAVNRISMYITQLQYRVAILEGKSHEAAREYAIDASTTLIEALGGRSFSSAEREVVERKVDGLINHFAP